MTDNLWKCAFPSAFCIIRTVFRLVKQLFLLIFVQPAQTQTQNLQESRKMHLGFCKFCKNGNLTEFLQQIDNKITDFKRLFSLFY